MTLPADAHAFDLVVFDWDGTPDGLHRPHHPLDPARLRRPGPAGARARPRQPCDRPGAGGRHAPCLPGLPAERYQDMVNAYRTHYLAGDQAIELFDGVAEALARWRARRAAGGGHRQEPHRPGPRAGRHGPGRVLCHHPHGGRMPLKPHPQMLDDITEFLGADKRRTLMVGDTTHDLQMAQNAGTWGAGVSYGAHPVEALRLRAAGVF